mgnify:CR=1 FL=1
MDGGPLVSNARFRYKNPQFAHHCGRAHHCGHGSFSLCDLTTTPLWSCLRHCGHVVRHCGHVIYCFHTSPHKSFETTLNIPATPCISHMRFSLRPHGDVHVTNRYQPTSRLVTLKHEVGWGWFPLRERFCQGQQTAQNVLVHTHCRGCLMPYACRPVQCPLLGRVIAVNNTVWSSLLVLSFGPLFWSSLPILHCQQLPCYGWQAAEVAEFGMY